MKLRLLHCLIQSRRLRDLEVRYVKSYLDFKLILEYFGLSYATISVE